MFRFWARSIGSQLTIRTGRGPLAWIQIGFASFTLVYGVPNRARAVANSVGSPLHSHSIVSSTRNYLKMLIFRSSQNNFTVRSTVKTFCLVPIVGDRWRNQKTGVPSSANHYRVRSGPSSIAYCGEKMRANTRTPAGGPLDIS